MCHHRNQRGSNDRIIIHVFKFYRTADRHEVPVTERNEVLEGERSRSKMSIKRIVGVLRRGNLRIIYQFCSRQLRIRSRMQFLYQAQQNFMYKEET